MLIELLRVSVSRTTAHVDEAVASMLAGVPRCVPSFVSNARGHTNSVRKRLEMQEDELHDTIQTLEAFVQQSIAGDGTRGFLEGSVDGVLRLLRDTDALPDVSCGITSEGSENSLRHLVVASRVDLGVDSERCVVAHERWLTRAQNNVVTIALADVTGEPVCGVTPANVGISVDSGALGWSVSTVSVAANTVTLVVELSFDCTTSAILDVNIGGVKLQLVLQVCMFTLCRFVSPNQCVGMSLMEVTRVDAANNAFVLIQPHVCAGEGNARNGGCNQVRVSALAREPAWAPRETT